MDDLDVLVVGGGPAGIAAALWAETLRLRAIVLDAGATPGGQLHRVYGEIVDYPGIASVEDGDALAARFVEHLDRIGAHVRSGVEALRLDAATRTLETSEGVFSAACVVLATGIRRRTLGVPGEADVVGRGHSPAASRVASQFRGKRVLVVGGGDAAFEEALILAKEVEHVTLAHRGATVRARSDFRARVAADSRISVLPSTELEAIEGDDRVVGARLVGPDGPQRIDIAGVFVCVGVVPNSELVDGQLELDEKRFVHADARQRTSIDRVYAVGDVCAGSSWTIAAAVGQGAAAIKDIQRRISANNHGSDG